MPLPARLLLPTLMLSLAAATAAAQPAPPSPQTATPSAATTAPLAEPAAAPTAAQPAQAAAPVATPPAATPAPVAEPAPPTPPKLRIAAIQGAYGAAYQAAVLKPFTAATSIEVATAGAGDALDVVAVDAADLERKCSAGELRELPATRVGDAGATPQDFLDGALQRCGTATFAWSSLFVADPAKFAKRMPRSIKDVFNTRTFPGKRALPRNARGVLEAALMADGVAAADVYARLATEDGMKQALAEISSIANDIVWFDRPGDAIDLLRSGAATIALTSNTRAFLDTNRRGPLELIWDGQVYDVEYLAIPSASTSPAEAEKLIAFATASERLAEVARQIPYGPMRRSAIASVRQHAVTGEDLSGYLPTAPANMASAVRFDARWWGENSERVAAAVAAAWELRPQPAAAPDNRKPPVRRP